MCIPRVSQVFADGGENDGRVGAAQGDSARVRSRNVVHHGARVAVKVEGHAVPGARERHSGVEQRVRGGIEREHGLHDAVPREHDLSGEHVQPDADHDPGGERTRGWGADGAQVARDAARVGVRDRALEQTDPLAVRRVCKLAAHADRKGLDHPAPR